MVEEMINENDLNKISKDKLELLELVCGQISNWYEFFYKEKMVIERENFKMECVKIIKDNLPGVFIDKFN